jgi:hypothetical protein
LFGEISYMYSGAQENDMAAQQEQQIVDECPISHFSMIPHVIDDMGLSPYEYRLYGHLKRVTGENGGKCWKSTDTLAKQCKMAAGTISKAKKKLEQLELIRIEKIPGKPGRHFHRITIVNIWQRNADHFNSSGEVQSSPSEVQSSPDETKNNPSFTNNPPPTPTAGDAAPTPANLEEWLEGAEKAKNRSAYLRWYVVTLFPYFEPDLNEMKCKGYARVGGVAKQIGGMGYCMKLLWQAAGQRITGDPLRYITEMKKNGRTDNGRTTTTERVELATGLGPPLTEEYIASLGLLDD